LIAVDTNILVRAHRRGLPRHAEALQRLISLAEGDTAWAIPVFCFGEFLRVVTHPKILESPTVRVLSPGSRFPEIFADVIRKAQVRGNLVFDAQIAALCIEHSVEGLITLDRDFSHFPEIQTVKLDRSVP
jgi:predicted nucleic acid-binding protein